MGKVNSAKRRIERERERRERISTLLEITLCILEINLLKHS